MSESIDVSTAAPPSRPTIFSVVVPTYNRPDSLERCLEALAAQELPRERYEVVVVNDGGACSPQRLVERYRCQIDIRLIEQANAGPASARNAGAAVARGEYVAFTDDDCRPDPRWLRSIAEMVACHPGAAVGGRVRNALAEGVYSSASQHLIEFLYEYYNVAETGGRFFITSNLAFPVAGFRAVGGFDVSFPLAAAEDRDICDRWREAGMRMVYCEDAVVEHAHALGLRSYCRQHFNYGRGAYHLHRARTRRGEAQMRVEPPHFYSRLVTYPLSRTAPARAAALSTLLLVSQIVYVGGYLMERVRSGTDAAAELD